MENQNNSQLKHLITSNRVWSTFFFILCAYFYYLTRTMTMYWDSPYYLIGVETKDYFHTYHLLHSFFYHLFCDAYRLFVPLDSYRSLPAVLMLNSILSALGVVVFFNILKTKVDVRTAVLCALGLAVSRVYWKWANIFETYSAAGFLLICSLAVYLGYLKRPRRVFVVGLMHAFTVLLHSKEILLFPGIAFGILALSEGPLKKRLRDTLVYSFVLGTCIALTYLFVFKFGRHYRTWHDYYGALFFYLDPKLGGSWWSFNPLNAKVSIQSMIQSVSLFNRKQLFVLLPFVLLFIEAWRKKQTATLFSRILQNKALVAVFACLAFYGIFFSLFNPGYDGYYVPYAIFTWLMLGLLIFEFRQTVFEPVRLLLLLYVLLLTFSFNMEDRILARWKYRTSPFLLNAIDYKNVTTEKDVIIMNPLVYSSDAIWAYFSNGRTTIQRNPSQIISSEILAQLKEAKGRIFVDRAICDSLNSELIGTERVASIRPEQIFRIQPALKSERRKAGL